MNVNSLLGKSLLGICCSLLTGAAIADKWSGNIAAEILTFPKKPLSEDLHDYYLSASVENEYKHQWDNGHQWFNFKSFFRGNQYDSRRSHFDIRELNVGYAGEKWEVIAGISKVYWGVTESQHLVDIVNQTDLVENLDTEDKLGQPMLNIAYVADQGTLNMFLLPVFRERAFLGKEGRPSTPLVVDQDNERYEADIKYHDLDFAVRWFQYLGDWEIGLSHFSGTSRTPELVLTPTGTTSPPLLTPVYHQIEQTGLELQGAYGAWLWKLEAIRNTGFSEHAYMAAVSGFEYTFVLESGVEIGTLIEYIYDERGNKAPTQFQDDLLFGTRITFNDVQSTQILAGVITDLDGGARSYNLEASRRLGSSWKVELEARGVYDSRPGDFLYSFRRDNSIRLNLALYF
ncbi:MAG: hypothetical protein V3V12_09835 [Gammaproteobacteria bacterium]